MARTDPQINLRIPADLKERIEAAAKSNNRSMTAEIVSSLSAWYPPQFTLATREDIIQAVDFVKSRSTILEEQIERERIFTNKLLDAYKTMTDDESPELQSEG